MAPVALFAAEGVEAQALRGALALEEVVDGPWPIHRGEVGRYPVVLIETGVGKVAAAAAVAYARARFGPAQAFWLGVAGALNPALKPLDLVLAQDAVQYDVDITAFGRSPGELATGERFIPADPVLTSRLARTATLMGLPVFLGRIASGDRFLADRAQAEEVRSIFGADAVEMEGAAALWTARRVGLPMALVRSITDQAGHDAPPAFEAFLQGAAERLAALMRRALGE
ncbi:5'-methylthioadenosine/S-adenosylhomocysteine nucleosidase [Meiothermus sp. QL-1]|uniref:5'-methylthioadenosine/S-adenosylhomocysteine nucleosidase n=1 Tax=Meiothermus sp. QL-1 TaxID=2058095 RepID=UPI000E0B737E|nr:5'-methylthioadenosine/S-adenosylhomocysteine nucleosidase [Meiothermus sp. QL-1]RDI96663.1 5'-methylthioadenosine/S-adenosylhomocysteine nucleosidase [Meiothermus sp. QL-1]